MKVLDEEEILRELVAARLAEAAEINFIDNKNKNVNKNKNNRRNRRMRRNRNNNKENNNNNNNNNISNTPITYTDQRTKLPFLLILVRKVQRKCYDFIYHPAETYERIDEIYQLTPVESTESEGDSPSSALQEGGVTSASAATEVDLDEEEGAVWTNGHASASSGSSSSSGSSDEEEEEDEENSSSHHRRHHHHHHHHHHEPFEPYYVGKAIFHTVSGEPLLKVEGSLGWREALKEKYNFLDAQSKAQVEERSNVASQKQKQRNHTTAKAVASAAIGGAGTTYAAAGMMATATTATETAAAATAATGGMMQTVGTVGVMAAAPLGLAAAGAIGGLGTYYFIHRRNKAKRNRKKRIEEEKEKLKYVEEMAQELAATGSSPSSTTATTRTDSSSTLTTDLTQADMVEKDPNKQKDNNQYQRLSEEDPATGDDDDGRSNMDFWVLVTAKRIEEMEDWEEYAYDHEVYEDQKDADQSFSRADSSNTAAAVAKALFDPHGVVRRVNNCDPTDRDGWETALSLHYNYLIERQGSLLLLRPTTSSKNDVSKKKPHSGVLKLDDTPLLLDE